MKDKTQIYYEARLNIGIKRKLYSYTTYKKGTVLGIFTEKQFQNFTLKNIDDHFSPQVLLGNGAYEYFDIEKDIEFFKIQKLTTFIEQKVKLKKK